MAEKTPPPPGNKDTKSKSTSLMERRVLFQALAIGVLFLAAAYCAPQGREDSGAEGAAQEQR